MQFNWRTASGPILTAATALIAFAVDRNGVVVPNLAPVFVFIVAFAASLGGLAAGAISAALAIALTFWFDATATPGLNATELARLALLAVASGGAVAVTGLLRRKVLDAFESQRQRHGTAERLSAALDQIDIGVVLLDSDTRAEFINRAFRDYFALPDEKADSKPPFIALMYHSRDAGAYEMPEDRLGDFIARRTELMRAGDSTPIAIKLADGQVMRFRCAALPDGGRMLSYTPVTDLVRHTDDPARKDEYLSLRGGGDHPALTPSLRAAE